MDGNGTDYGVNPSGEICSTSRDFTMTYTVGEGTDDELRVSRKYTVREGARKKATATAIIKRTITSINVDNGGLGYAPTDPVVIDAPGPCVQAEGLFDFTNPLNPRVILTNPGFGYKTKPTVIVDFAGGEVINRKGNIGKRTYIQLLNIIANTGPVKLGDKLSENIIVHMGRLKQKDAGLSLIEDFPQLVEVLRFITTTLPVGRKGFAIIFGAPPDGVGNAFEDGRADAELVINSLGVITGITLTNAGFGYTTAPNITIKGGDSTARASAVLTAGVITDINVDSLNSSRNFGYKNVEVGVNIVDLTGSGNGAIARAIVEGEQVTSIIVDNGGLDYDIDHTTVEITGVENDDTTDTSIWLEGLQEDDYQSKYYLSYIVRDAAGDPKQTINLTLNVVYFCLDLKEPQISELTVYDEWNDPGITVNGQDAITDSTGYRQHKINSISVSDNIATVNHVADTKGRMLSVGSSIRITDMTQDDLNGEHIVAPSMMPTSDEFQIYLDTSLPGYTLTNGTYTPPGDAFVGTDGGAEYSYTASEPRMWKAESQDITYSIAEKKDSRYLTEIKREVRKKYKLAWYDAAEITNMANDNLTLPAGTLIADVKCIQYIMEDNFGEISSFSLDSSATSYNDLLEWLTGTSAGHARTMQDLAGIGFDQNVRIYKNEFDKSALLRSEFPLAAANLLQTEVERLLDFDDFGEFEEKLNKYFKNKGVDITSGTFSASAALVNIIAPGPVTVDANKNSVQDNFKIKVKIFTTKADPTVNQNTAYIHEDLVIKGEDDSNVYTLVEPAVDTTTVGSKTVTYTVTKKDDADIESSINRTINVI